MMAGKKKKINFSYRFFRDFRLLWYFLLSKMSAVATSNTSFCKSYWRILSQAPQNL